MLKLLVCVAFVVVTITTSRPCQAVVVLEHEEATLTCDISPTAPRTSAVFWYSNVIYEYLTSNYDRIPELLDAAPSLYQRLFVEGSVRRGKYNLRIVDVRAEDEGDYLCGYYRNGDEWITVKTVSLAVLTPPGREFPACSVQSPGDTLLLPGMLVNLSCISYGGNPPADLAWYRAGVPLDGVVAHDGLWVYHQLLIQEEDSGVEFTCEATSTALPEPKSCSIVPYHRAPLLHIEHVHDGFVTLGDSATFTCASQRMPRPVSASDEARYHWYINGQSAEESRSGITIEDNGNSITLLDITARDDKVVVSCEKVDEFTTRSSASLTIQVVSPMSPVFTGGIRDSTPSWQPDSSVSTPEPPISVSQVGFVTCIIGAFCFGMFFMLFLIVALRLLCNYARKRGRMDINTDRELSVGWHKTVHTSCNGVKHNHITLGNEKPIPDPLVRTFKKPGPIVANGNTQMNDCAECSQSSDTDDVVRSDTSSPRTAATPQRSTTGQQSRHAVSYDLLPGPTRKKPPPLSLFNETKRPLLSSPSPSAGGRRTHRLPSVDRDYTASMPDLASRFYGEPGSVADHDYVNLPAAPSPRERSGSSTPSSYVNCEFVSPIPPTTPVKKQPLKPSCLDQKSLSYAELDLPSIRERPSTPLSPGSPGANKLRAGSVSVERTKYAQIAYVFKDRRQQSLPSVKLVGLSEGFGDNV